MLVSTMTPPVLASWCLRVERRVAGGAGCSGRHVVGMSASMARSQATTASLRAKSVSTLVMAVVTLCSGCVVWEQSDPRLIRGTSTPEIEATCRSGREARVAMAKTVLNAHIGQPFPDLTLLDKHGAAVHLATLRAGRTALLYVCCPSAESVAWMQELEAQNWAPPPGYDRLLIVAMGFGEPVFDRLVARKAPSAFFVGLPLQDYLAAVLTSPILFGVSADGTLQDYWLFEDRGKLVAAGLSTQPIFAPTPPPSAVTAIGQPGQRGVRGHALHARV